MDDHTGWPLHFLVQSDHFYNEFLERLEDPDKRDFEGNTLLHAAARTWVDNSRNLQLLLDRGARVDSTNLDGHTPLHFAVYFRNRRAVATLLEAGASVNSKDSTGGTPLHFAITEDWPDCSCSILHVEYDRWTAERLLCRPGINLNPLADAGETPLMWAVIEENAAAVALLLEKGADPNIPNEKNQTPLHVLLSFRNPEYRVVDLFLHKGADIYCEDISGQTVVDILVRTIRDDHTLEFAKGAVRLIALRYRIRDCLRRKLQQMPDLYNHFEECVEEVSLMRKQIVSDEITLHDFCLDCFQTRLGDHGEEDINIPVFEILSSGLFEIYYDVILSRMIEGEGNIVFWKY